MNVIGVDVGTTSVRLAIISFTGEQFNEVNILASQEKQINYIQDGLKFEQSSEEIWRAICECSKNCIQQSLIQPDSIRAIAFSATCSLVIKQKDDKTLKDDEFDIIMWMDHRAIGEAQAISKSNAKVLNQFGGVCSPEFSLAKLIWLKNHEPERFHTASCLLELPDWLVYRCIGGDPALCPGSLCCVVCKWGYDADKNCHCDILKSFDDKLWKKTSARILKPGTVSGVLSSKTAKELGLIERTSNQSEKENQKPSNVIIGTSLIDAHSGMLGMLSVPLESYGINLQLETTFCSLAGTSSCHMLLSKQKNFTHGIWGPYKNVILDGYNLLEAGQSLTGKLIEMCIESHSEGKKYLENGQSMKDIIRTLNNQITSLETKATSPIHVLPTYHGSRSPLANPRLLGGIYGLSSEGQNSLLDQYIATIESIVYETKFIVETMGIKLNTILVSGGLMKNEFFMQTLANVLICQVVRMSLKNVDFMVMGSGLVARHAVMMNSTVKLTGGEPMRDSHLINMQYPELGITIYRPQKDSACYHERKYLCYKEFVEFSKRVDEILHL